MMLKIAKHKYGGSRVWWYIPVTPGTQEAEQEDHKFEVSLSQNKKGWQCSSVVEGPWFQSPVLKKEGKEKKKKEQTGVIQLLHKGRIQSHGSGPLPVSIK